MPFSRLPSASVLSTSLGIGLGLLQSQAQTTISVDNLRVWFGTGNQIGGSSNVGTLVVHPSAPDWPNGDSGLTQTDARMRIQNLDLDGMGGNNDYIDFSLRFVASRDSSPQVSWSASGIGVNGDFSTGTNEVMTVSIADVSLSPGTSGSVTFDGFTAASIYLGGTNITTDGQLSVNGSPYSNSFTASGFAFQITEIPQTGLPATVIINNILASNGDLRWRQGDFQFTYTPAVVLPVHGLTLKPSKQDLDGNGLPDVWEALFGAKGIDPLADSDGDGVSNADEANAGTDPFDPQSALKARAENAGSGQMNLFWSSLEHRPGQAETTTTLASGGWQNQSGTPSLQSGEWRLTLPTTSPARFFRIRSTESDTDNDGVPDWLESRLGFSTSSNSSASRPVSYDTNNDQVPDTNLSGDLSAFNQIYRKSEPGSAPTRAQASRFLIQSTFGPATSAEVNRVVQIGIPAWIDEQVALPPSLTKPYIQAIKADWNGTAPDPSLAGYAYDPAFVRGINFPTAWARSAINGQDQLRQRVAWALSQILVTSRSGANLGNQPEAIAHYYDLLVNNAFGNYKDLLLEVSLSPVMGNYLSHLGNRKADPSIKRFPDENFAREIMQLFTIGLWQLNPDGSRKLDTFGEPIPTYGNFEITELARVFTGTNYASTNFGGGWRDDGLYMTTPMKAFASEHDFGAKQIVNGHGTTHTIPARSSSNENAMADVVEAVTTLFNHPNTAPFICRQLIQFLVTSNPSPAYVQRVSTVFQNNGSGTAGDLASVVRAILLDDEARDPLQHLSTPHFGQLREPAIRTMHLSRILNMGSHSNLRWWDWGTYLNNSLQDPMNSPTVFNYFRPDFSLFGQLADNQLHSPVFGIVDSYSSISFPNHLWTICNTGFKDGNNISQSPDLTALVALASDVPALLDHLSLMYCAGTLGANSRATITTALNAETNMTERARLAAYLVLVSPEGSCLK